MRRRFFQIDQNVPYFASYWAPKWASPFIWTNLNSHLPSMFPTSFGWNWRSGSWEEDFFKTFPYILLCKSLSPWVAPYMTLGTLFGHTWSSLSQGCSMPNINVFRPVVHEKSYQNLPYSVPKGASPFIWTNLNPHPQACFLPSLIEIGLVVLEKKSFQRRRTTDAAPWHKLRPGEL